ncbi:lipopolysaccharide assembly protein LapA domain-containing protein [Embleya sp. NPDC050154]|uniref:lipopolysaccharide assembly protein LapA domain-containing protein n=1 Tax=unclassified Embleya TaxID=2699296 RepID=UPI00378A057D
MAKTSKHGTAERGSRVTMRQIVIVVVIALSVWFVLANTGTTSIRFWIPEVEAPLWFVLAGSFVVGALIGWLIGRNRRPR